MSQLVFLRIKLDFFDLVLIYCIILDSPLIDDAESEKIKQNESAVISNGNNPELQYFLMTKNNS